MNILVTGAAGFIGMHVCQKLLQRGDTVVGIDNLNDYYSPALKLARLEQLQPFSSFSFEKLDVADTNAINGLFAEHKFDSVVHLAAQAGVRYSLQNPMAYAQSNLIGFTNILEACRHNPVQHLVYASSSSVYGGNTKVPFSEADNVDHPVSFYAASKKANELMAHSYAHLYGIPSTGLRFFTVYGPWGRPDMAMWLFTEAILQDKPIKVFNHGKLQRDFTYVDDIVEGVVRVLDQPATPAEDFANDPLNPAISDAPHRIFNIGNHQPVELETFISTLEQCLGKPAIKNYMDMQAGDVFATYADTSRLQTAVGFHPDTKLADGIAQFVNWYKQYHGA